MKALLFIFTAFLLGCSANKFPVNYSAFTILPNEQGADRSNHRFFHDGYFYQKYVDSLDGENRDEWNKIGIRMFFENGTSWGLGWELGRAVTSVPGYHEYFRVPIQRMLNLRP